MPNRAGMMKIAFSFFLCANLAANSAYAASILEFDLWMRKIDNRIVDVQRSIASHNDAIATAQAREIEDLYAKMEAYFIVAGNSKDAVKLSKDSKDLAALILKSVATKDYETSEQAAVTIAKTCTDCHDLYRPL